MRSTASCGDSSPSGSSQPRYQSCIVVTSRHRAWWVSQMNQNALRCGLLRPFCERAKLEGANLFTQNQLPHAASGGVPSSAFGKLQLSGNRRRRDLRGGRREVFVFHFPGVVHCVICAVANQEGQVPRTHPLPLTGVVGPHRGDIRLAVATQPFGCQRALLGDAQPQSLGEILALVCGWYGG